MVHFLQDRQCARYVTVWCFRLTFVPPRAILRYHLTDRLLLWQFNVTGNNKMYLSRRAKCHVFLPEINKIRIFSKDFHRSFQYQI